VSRIAVPTDFCKLKDAGHKPTPGVLDVLIVGEGLAGIGASLRAIEDQLSYVTLEREDAARKQTGTSRGQWPK